MSFPEAPDGLRPTSATSNGYSFDSNATPQQKKVEAMRSAPAGLKTEKRNRGHELISDTTALPTISMPAPSSAGSAKQDHDGKAQGLARQDGAVIGWEMAGGSNRDEYRAFIDDQDGMNGVAKDHRGADHTTALEGLLPEGLYGDWYHNAGIIAFCVLFSWIVGRFGGGLSWVIIIGAIGATYYRTSIRRVRRNVRDDISRQLAKSKLETDTESAEWMNSFLTKFWIIYEPVLSATIVASVDQVLAATPLTIVESMRLAFFTLGTKPPRIEHVKTYPKSEDDIVLMDWRFSFTPNDTEDLTARQLKNKINPKIELAVRAGVSIAAVNIPIIVEDIAFSGLMQVRIKLMTEFPHIKIVDLSFLEKPDIGYVLKPVGGSTLGFDVGFIPGLSGIILDLIHASLAPMMYAPNVFTLNIQQMLSGVPLDSAIGVAVVTLHGCNSLRNTDIGSGKPDPYITLGVSSGEIARTEIIKSANDPKFNETKTLLLTTLTDSLNLEVFDYNEVRKDKSLGLVAFDLKRLEEEPEIEHVSEKIMANGKERGNMNFSIHWYPVLTAPKLDDGTDGPVPESKSGIVRFTVHQAKNLGGGKNCSPYALLTMNSKQIAKTSKMKHTHNPVWDFSKEILVADRDSCILGVQIKNDDFASDSLLGSHAIKLNDLLQNTKDEVDDFMLKQAVDPSSKVKLSAVWKPVAMGDQVGSRTYLPPIGALRVHFYSAQDLRNPELGLTGGKADPYMRVMVNGESRARTVVVKNEQNPDWDEIVYLPIRSSREKVYFEVMDYQARTKDRSLGQVQIDLPAMIHQGEDGAYASHLDEQVRVANFTGKDAKGSLKYTVSFHAAYSVMTKDEEQEQDKLQLEAAKANPDAASVATGASRLSETTSSGVDQKHARSTSHASGFSRTSVQAPKIRLTKDDVLHYNSGFLVFELLEGSLPESGYYLQVLFDDHLYPAYTTAKSRSRSARWNETGEGFVRELDASRITLRINKEADSTDDDTIVAQVEDDTLNVLRRSFNEVVSQTLRGRDGRQTTITFRCHYIPVPLTLEPRESVNNMGVLRITIVGGSKLCAADRGNKSDPYAKIYIDTQREHVYKTETIKKTLNPQWNESFEQPITSLLDNVLRVEVYDWDLADKDDFLGSAQIPIANLSPMSMTSIEVALDGPNGGNGKSGTVAFQLLFKPGFITRTKRGNTTRTFTRLRGPSISSTRESIGSPSIRKNGSFLGRSIGLGKSKNIHNGPEISVTPDGGVLVQDGHPPLPSAQSKAMQFGDAASPPSSSVVVPPVPGIPARLRATSSTLNTTTTNGGSETVTYKVRLLRGENFPEKKTIVKITSRSGKTLGKSDPLKSVQPAFELVFNASLHPTDAVDIALIEHNTFSGDKLLSSTQLVLASVAKGQASTVKLDNGAVLFLDISLVQVEAASIKSHRGLGLGGHFRKSSAQRER